MPATISEHRESRPFTVGKQSTRELVYLVQGTADEQAVEDLLATTAPPAYGGLALDALSAEPIEVDEEQDEGLWRCSARYATPESGDEYTFDTGGGTAKMTQSLATVARYAPAGLTAPDFKGAIGVSEDRVEGVDVHSAQFQFTETHSFSDAFVSGAYKLTVFALTGRVNAAAFKGLAAGECLFLGASGSKRGADLWTITFRFSGSANAVDLTFGDIQGVAKKGWEYAWFRYAQHEDATAKALAPRPISCHIEQVYATGDFSLLGIGV